jgi:hypothetical protein
MCGRSIVFLYDTSASGSRGGNDDDTFLMEGVEVDRDRVVGLDNSGVRLMNN